VCARFWDGKWKTPWRIRAGEPETKSARGKAKLARTFALQNQMFVRAKQIWCEAKSEAKCPFSDIYISWPEA
jgi:hypothetical protein